MSNPTNDPRVVTARAILDEAAQLGTLGASRADLIHFFSRVQSAARMLLDYVDEREPATPDIDGGGHTFIRTDGDVYRCQRCGRETDQDNVYRLSILEECEAGEGR